MKKVIFSFYIIFTTLLFVSWQTDANAMWGSKTKEAGNKADNEVQSILNDAKDFESDGDGKTTEGNNTVANIQCDPVYNIVTTYPDGGTSTQANVTGSYTVGTTTSAGTSVAITKLDTCLNAQDHNTKGAAAKASFNTGVEKFQACIDKNKQALDRITAGEQAVSEAASSEKKTCWLIPIPLNFACTKDVESAEKDAKNKLAQDRQVANDQKASCEKKKSDTEALIASVTTLESAGASQTTSTPGATGVITNGVNTGGSDSGIVAPTNGSSSDSSTSTSSGTNTVTTTSNSVSGPTSGGSNVWSLSGGPVGADQQTT